MTGLPNFEGATWHDSFARCPECGHATVGLSKPYEDARWDLAHEYGYDAP